MVLSLGVYALRRRFKFWINDPLKRKKARIFLFIPLIILLSITGHWGGSLTHGEDYLFAAMSLNAQEAIDPALKIRTITNIEEAVLYDDVIQPIFEARCYDCHSSRKQKGDLRLDKVEFIRRGGKDGEVISDGPADSSSLFKRLTLPLEHEDHMPPGEKPQLSSSEIALIKYWIEEKAHFEKPIGQFQNNEKISAIVQSLQEAPRQTWIPVEPVREAEEKRLRKLKDLGITPIPLAAENNYLMVNFTGSQNVTDQQVSSLQEIKEQLVWLNFSNTHVTDEQMDALSELSNLRVLYLNNTGISDTGLAKLSTLSELRLLSLVNTSVTDESISTLKNLKKLTSLFLYQTDLTKKAIQEFAAIHVDVNLDTGNYKLKQLPTDTIVYKRVNVKN